MKKIKIVAMITSALSAAALSAVAHVIKGGYQAALTAVALDAWSIDCLCI